MWGIPEGKRNRTPLHRVRPLARNPRILIGWPFPLGFGLGGRLLLARRGRVCVQFIIIIRRQRKKRLLPGVQNQTKAGHHEGRWRPGQPPTRNPPSRSAPPFAHVQGKEEQALCANRPTTSAVRSAAWKRTAPSGDRHLLVLLAVAVAPSLVPSATASQPPHAALRTPPTPTRACEIQAPSP